MEIKKDMHVRLRLANPALIFVYSLVLLLVGCAIGIHWSKSSGTAVGITICAALLMVIHDILEGLIWFGITAKWTRAVKSRATETSPSRQSPSRAKINK